MAQAEALLVEKAQVRRENASLTREMLMLNERVKFAEMALQDTELFAGASLRPPSPKGVV
jgi:hypothetical protein